MKKENSILIVGLGALGSVIYSRLDRKGYNMVCLTSENGRKLISKKGLVVELLEDKTPHLHTCEVYDVLPEKYEFGNVIVATKSWINETLVDSLSSNLIDDASILIFQNGINIEESFIKAQKEWKITRTTTSLSALREAINHSLEANVGETRIGGVNHNDIEEISSWRDLLVEIGLPTEISQNIRKDIWLKSMVNCSIGPLGAITGLVNGQIIEDNSLNFLVRSIIEEILPLTPKELMINFYEVYNLVETIVKQTANHKCSMLQDIENGYRTEIDTLNGKVVKLGAEMGIDLPLNSKLVEIVKKLSEENYPKELAILDLRSMF